MTTEAAETTKTKTNRKTIKAPTKKPKAIPRRIKTGLPAVPMSSFSACKRYFHEEIERKVISDIIKTWIKKTFTKDEAKAILANAEYNFHMYTHFGAAVHWINSGMEFTEEKYKRFPEALKQYYSDLIEPGMAILKIEAKKTAASEDNSSGPIVPVKLSPPQLLQRKIQSTIMVDLDFLEDEWIDKKTTTIDVYTKFQQHQLKGVAVQPVKARLEKWLNEYEDAYLKRCPQMVEGYSHIKRTELKRRVDAIRKMIEDLNKVKAASAATRTPRTPKAKAADKQIGRLQYLKSSEEYKLKSVNPIQIPGAMRLYTFNEKTRTLSEYVSSSAKGFEVKGTTLQNVDLDISRSVRLRKPDQFLAICLSKTARQIDNEWSKLTTKSTKPNGRLNKDTILLRILNQ